MNNSQELILASAQSMPNQYIFCAQSLIYNSVYIVAFSVWPEMFSAIPVVFRCANSDFLVYPVIKCLSNVVLPVQPVVYKCLTSALLL